MEQRVFSKSLLTAFALIDTYCDSINKQVYGRSIASSGLTAAVFEDTFTCIQGITNLIGRKVGLINLKIKIEKAVNAMEEVNSKILILKFIDNLSSQQIADLLNISQRQVFRRMNIALFNFCQNLKIMNITPSTFEEEYAEEKWIFNIIKRIAKEEIIKSAPKVPRHQMFA